ncbi:MAG: restriction endonuclease subunit S, partial [Faecalibacterium sp.]
AGNGDHQGSGRVGGDGVMIQLKDLCQKASSNIAQKDLEGHEGQYPIYGASGLIGYVDFYKQENPYVAVVKDGAGIGRVMCLPEKSSVIGTMQYILPNEGVNVHYLAFAMEHMNLAKYFSGATIPHIYFKDYCTERLPKNSEAEQKQISTTLSRVTELISLRKQQLSKLDELVKARFVEMFGDSVANTKNFPSTTLETVMTVFPQNGLYKPQTDYVQDDTGIPILRIDAFYNGKVTNWNTLKRLICSETEIDRYLLKENDIVINRVNSIEYLGKCAHIVGLKEKTVFESNMMRFHMDEKKVNAVYVTEVLCTEDIYRQILRRAKKSVNQASINQEDVKSLEILVPPLSLQNQFAAFVERVDQQKQTVQQSLEKLELMKKALMQEYFG